jgi:hypothetical protein
MGRVANPARRVAAVHFTDENGAGLMLNGNHLTLLDRPRLVATQSPTGPVPVLRRLGGGAAVEVYRHAYRPIETGQLLYLWALTRLDDGDYALESTFRYRKRLSTIWENLFGLIHFAVAHGALAHLRLDPVYHEPPVDLSPEALARRASGITMEAPADDE